MFDTGRDEMNRFIQVHLIFIFLNPIVALLSIAVKFVVINVSWITIKAANMPTRVVF